jgi:hypothetical protein
MAISKKRSRTARPTPKWKSKRRRCLSDNKLFYPKLQKQRFCSDACRKEFHRYGESYGPIKMGLERALEKKSADLEKQLKQDVRAIKDQMCVLREQIELILVERNRSDAKPEAG